jgi:hypothetical protein
MPLRSVLLACVAVATPAMACPWHNDMTAAEVDAVNAAQAGIPLNTGGSGLEAISNTATIGGWKLNLTGATGNSPNATINSFINTVSADVQQVWFDSNYVYVKHTDVPSHAVGNVGSSNTGYPQNLNRTSRIPRNPTVAGTSSLGNGPVAVMANGGLAFDGGDAQSYNNQNTWRRLALQFEGATFDTAPGHVAPGLGQTPGNSTPGTYHYHVGATGVLSQIDPGNTGQRHSALLGFAFDGFPIYGPYGYSDPNNASSAIKRITSSYTLRSDLATTGSQRKSVTENGTTLATNLWGPNVSSTYPAGSFKEDYKYVAGLGDLNDYNMRFARTPEYPDGTWAYYMTVDSGGAPAYPYLIGPKYYGVVDTANLGPTGGNVTIPSTAKRLYAGDANFDGNVNFDDLLLLASNYNATGVTLWSQGDFNADANVNFDDLLQLAANYSTTQAGALGGDWALALATVPEPGAVSIIFGGVLVGLTRRWRK